MAPRPPPRALALAGLPPSAPAVLCCSASGTDRPTNKLITTSIPTSHLAAHSSGTGRRRSLLLGAQFRLWGASGPACIIACVTFLLFFFWFLVGYIGLFWLRGEEFPSDLGLLPLSFFLL
ncbi:hypothetical protein BT67DRAFT_159482 [Trichocladium antarcticum]|uniref:Uncharacterized protein n=1 Tax=Trichocladium antarcticum TaxID=1450529 RepID=A0AAN6UE21_9PEZI|nr:hypothetical protein BT67DRAFT_159482 [Trichocladium antarcticum]